MQSSIIAKIRITFLKYIIHINLCEPFLLMSRGTNKVPLQQCILEFKRRGGKSRKKKDSSANIHFSQYEQWWLKMFPFLRHRSCNCIALLELSVQLVM